ncbi:MAG TPA: hemolysin III family protein [Kiritimatiellia bacterium]|nr:hemolysin III family protein [Kiritimatiellia bacterium]
MYHGERFNSISHVAGAIAALAGLAVLVVLAAQQGDPYKVVSFSIYGVTLFLLYLFSSLYHSIRHPSAKAILRKLDHHSISLLIAGSYTPFTLVTLRGGWGWSLFGVVWGLALLGAIVEYLPVRGGRILPVIIYLLMGWMIVIALVPLLKALPRPGFWGLAAGGMFYTVGVGFYAFGRRIRHFHGIWHLFVLAGSACHYFTILLYVL